MFNKETTVKGVTFKGLWIGLVAIIGVFIGTLLTLSGIWSTMYYYYGGSSSNAKLVIGSIILVVGIAFAFIFAVKNSGAIAKLLFGNIAEVLKHLVCVLLATTVLVFPAFGLALAIEAGTIMTFAVVMLAVLVVVVSLIFTYAFVQMVTDLSALRKELCIDESATYEEEYAEDFDFDMESPCSGVCSSCGIDCDSREDEEAETVEATEEVEATEATGAVAETEADAVQDEEEAK